MIQTDFKPNLSELVLSRRTFLKACSILSLYVTSCAPLLKNSRATSMFLVDPSADDYGPVLCAVIEAVLAFEHPQFPALTVTDIENQLWEFFPLEREEKYRPVQRALMIFDDLALYASPASPIVYREFELFAHDKDLIDDNKQTKLDSILATERAHYQTYIESVGESAAEFSKLSVDARRKYLQLWATSEFAVRRLFYSSLKSLIMVSAYSRPEMWQAIGYAGPFLTLK